VLRSFHPKIDIVAYVAQSPRDCGQDRQSKVKLSDVDANIVRCPDKAAARKMISLIEKTRAEGDSLGGVIECVVRNAPVGLGEPVFDKLEADLAKAMLSLPATKGFEIGSGFSATRMRGSEHNDPFEVRGGKVRTSTNYSGGIQAESRTAKRFIAEWRSNQRQRLRANRKLSARRASKRNLRRADVTIRACCRARCRWSKRWRRWCV